MIENDSKRYKSDKLFVIFVLALILWTIFRLVFRVYGADKWKTVYISKCHCQISYPLYWLDGTENARRGPGLDDAVSWHASALLSGTNKSKIFFHPAVAPSSNGLEEWITNTLTEMRAHDITDMGEQIIGRTKIIARYRTYQLSYDHRIYYFYTEDGYYAVDFFSKNFSKHEEMFAQILASFEFLE